MRKILTIIISITILISCKSVDTDSGCNENLKFKDSFFSHIKYIQQNVTNVQDSTFIKSVIFISNYAPVSTDNIMNYVRSYPLGIFKQDHEKWLEWYEENRCRNIQFKSEYVIPEVYKDVYEAEHLYIPN